MVSISESNKFDPLKIGKNETLQLFGTIFDDKKPVPAKPSWSAVGSNSSKVSITGADKVSAKFKFAETGTYTLRFTGSDGAKSAYEDVVVIVD